MSRLLCALLLSGISIDAYATAPVITGSPSKTATVGVAYAFQPTASDVDGDALTFSIMNRPGWATFDTRTGRLSGTPALAYTHSNIVISVSDGLLKSSLPAFAINVAHAPNAPRPSISGTPPKTVAVGAAYSFQPSATTSTGTLTFLIVNKPGWATFSSTTGRLSGTPTQPAMHSNIQLGVSNGSRRAWLPTFSISVTGAPANAPPSISGTPATSVTVGSSYAFQPTAADADGDALTFSIANQPSWATFNSTTGRLSGTPTASHVGSYANITIGVTDGRTPRYLPAFVIAVNAVANTPPSISGTPATAVTVGSPYSFQPTASDADGDALTFSIANQPSWATFNSATGRLSGTPTASHVGSYANITISVSDGTTTRSLPAFTIGVNAVALGSARISWTPPAQNTDGSALTDLSGYRIYYGTRPDDMTQMILISGIGTATYLISNLSPATYYFAVTAYNSRSIESDRSATVTKVIN